MVKKIIPATDYISAGESARILSEKFARPVDPHYIPRLRNVRFLTVNPTTKLYLRADIEAVTVRQRRPRCAS